MFDITFTYLTVYLNCTNFLSFCFALFLIFFVGLLPLFHFLRIVCSIMYFSSKHLSQIKFLPTNLCNSLTWILLDVLTSEVSL